MKSTIQFLLSMAFIFVMTGTFEAMAQVPQLFNYQGIARDAKGNPLSNQKMSLKLSVLPTADATVAEYEETQLVNTNEFGLYTLQIGNGTAVTGQMKTVKWETGNKYIKVAIDPTGGNNYVDAGTNQLLSVPYAIYADKAGTAADHDKTRTGAVNSNAAHVAGDANYLTKFTALNTIGKSLIFENSGTGNIGIGTVTPGAKFQITNTVAAVQEHFRMQNLSTTGAGRFTMYNDGVPSYATFTKYGSAFAGGYAGVAAMYPFANLLAFGNNGLAANDGNGRFLISTAGNAGISIFKSGTSKLKFHADFATENVGIGGNATPAARVHLNNTDGTSMNTLLTNNTTGHTNTDGLEISNTGNAASIINKENSTLSLGTNNATVVTMTAAGNTELAGQIKIAGGAPGVGKLLLSDATGLATWSTPAGAGLISGSGTANVIPKFTPNGTTLGNSMITDNGTEVTIGVNPPGGSTINVGSTALVDTPSVGFYNQTGGDYGTVFLNGDGQLQFTPNTANPSGFTPTFTLDDDGGGATFAESVGVGISPSYRLHVKSDFPSTNPLVVENSATSNPLFVVNEGVAGNGFVGVYDNLGVENGRIAGGADARSWMMGEVGIGTNTPTNGKLHVISSKDTAIFSTTTSGTNRQVGVYGTYNIAGYGAGVLGRGFGGVDKPTTRDIGVYGTSGDIAVWSQGRLKVVDGTEGDGKVLTSDGTGTAAWRTNIGFNASSTTPVNIADNATLIRIYGVVSFNDGNAYNPATGVFTAPATGVYQFNYSEVFSAVASSVGHAAIKLTVNGASAPSSAARVQPGGINSANWSVENSVTLRLNAGDAVRVVVDNANIGATITTTSFTVNGGFSGFRIY